MRGIMIASVLCVVMCLHYADAQWPTWVLSKGKTCEDRCKTKLKMCKPVEEFMDCKCIPRQVLQNYLKYATLPIEPSVICLMSSPKAPKCCGIYNKQKDAFKNSESDSQEIQQLKDKLGAEQTENEQCKTKLDAEQDQHDELKKTCGSSRQDNVCMSNLTADMFHTLGEKNRIQDAGMQQLKENLAVMSSTIQQLEKKLHSEEVRSDALETKIDAEILQLSNQTTKALDTMGEKQTEQQLRSDALETKVDAEILQLSSQTTEALDTLDTKIGSQILQLSNQTTESIDNIETLIESESETMKTIETRIESMEEEGVHMANRTASMSIMLHEQNQELGKLTQAWSSEPWKKLAGANPIGFSATDPVWLGDGDGVALGFTTVHSNEGGAFNHNTGIFTCPVAGMYYFIMHLTKKRTDKSRPETKVDRVYCSIKRDGEYLSMTHIDPEDGTADYGSYGVSGSVFIKLNVGDRVQLANCRKRGSLESWSSFTGFLVAQ